MGKFVEFFGPGVAQLSIADRATISNMCPEYGATVGFFPVDNGSLKYLKQTGKQQNRLRTLNIEPSTYVFVHMYICTYLILDTLDRMYQKVFI